MTTQSEKTLTAVRQFAEKMHAGQTYGVRPYTAHLDDVDCLVVEASLHDYLIATYIWTLRAAAYLHDVAEDTAVTLADLRSFLYELLPPGSESFEPDLIVDTVRAVTDPPGANRSERKEVLIERMSREPYPVNKLALATKLCDRLANVRRCRADIARDVHHDCRDFNCSTCDNKQLTYGLLEMYRREQAEFSRLRTPGELEYLWGRLSEALS